MGEGEADAAGSAGDEDVTVGNWDLDWTGTDDEVEEGEENERKENKEREERVCH